MSCLSLKQCQGKEKEEKLFFFFAWKFNAQKIPIFLSFQVKGLQEWIIYAVILNKVESNHMVCILEIYICFYDTETANNISYKYL